MYVCISCRVDAHNKVETFKQDDIDDILKDMITHQGKAGVQEEGCAKLSKLGYMNAENQVEIAKQGGIVAILKGMITHQATWACKGWVACRCGTSV